MGNARKTAIDALLKVNNDFAYSNITLNNILKTADLSSADKALATALFYGVLDRRETLDYVISVFEKNPINKIDPLTKEVLRLGIYQLLFMEKIPQSAAVNESVKIIKSSKKSHNSGFVNAVLRAVTRQENILPQGDSVKDLSIRYSCPEWIIEGFLEDYSIEVTKKLLEETLKPTPTFVRVNTLRTTAVELKDKLEETGVLTEKCETENALKLKSGIEFEKTPLFTDGHFHVQDLSSQICAKTVGAKPDERILDICAAPGGKSFTMAQIMGNTGEIVACDLYKHRTELIEKGAKRLGAYIIKTVTADATVLNKELGLFDAVLCDVPCSGLGIIRRKPDIKYKGETDFKSLEDIQSKILDNAVNYVKPNGRLVYSTCTLRKKENERQVEDFLKKNTDFKLQYMHTFMPQIDGTDGFFIALMTR